MSTIDIGSQEKFILGKDSIVIRHYGDGVKGGAVLDVDGFADEFIKAGHVIIQNSTTSVFKPMPVSGTAYDSLPEGCVYRGILVETVPVAEPIGGIMTDGEVNDNALPYAISDIKSAFLAAVPTIRFDHD